MLVSIKVSYGKSQFDIPPGAVKEIQGLDSDINDGFGGE